MNIIMLLNVALITSIISVIKSDKSQSFSIYDLQLPHTIHSHGAGIYNNTLTILNGIHQDTDPVYSSYSVQLLPPSTVWKRHHLTLPLRATGILIEGDTTVQIEHLLYIFNPNIIGNDAIRYNVMLVYDLSQQQYVQSEASLLKTAFSCTVYNANNNLIYIIGGVDNSARFPVPAVSYTQTYSVSANKWARVSDINTARGYAGCAMDAAHENIFLFGGAESVDALRNRNPLRTIEAYSVAADKWNILQREMQSAKANIKCLSLPMDGKIYCSSARSSQLNYRDDDTKWEVFDPMDFSIDTVDINIPRVLFSLSVWGETCLIVTGGAELSEGVMVYYDSAEYLGECPPPPTTHKVTLNPTIVSTVSSTDILTLEPTFNPTVSPTNPPASTLYETFNVTEGPMADISQCFIGSECTRNRHCCVNGFARKYFGVRCGNRDSQKECCIDEGFGGCKQNRHCCGRTRCRDNICIKARFGGNGGAMVVMDDEQMESPPLNYDATAPTYSAMIRNLWILSTVYMVCVVLIIVAWCAVLRADHNNSIQSTQKATNALDDII